MINIKDYLIQESQNVDMHILADLWFKCLKPLQGNTFENVLSVKAIQAAVQKIVKPIDGDNALDEESINLLQQRINDSIAPAYIESAVICAMRKYIDANVESTDKHQIKIVKDKTFDFCYTDGKDVINFEVKAARNFKNARFNSINQRDGVDYLIYVEYTIDENDIYIKSVELLTPSKAKVSEEKLKDNQLSISTKDRKNGIGGKSLSTELYGSDWAETVKSGELNFDCSGFFKHMIADVLKPALESGDNVTLTDILPMTTANYKDALKAHATFITKDWFKDLINTLLKKGKISNNELQAYADEINHRQEVAKRGYRQEDICKLMGEL